MKEMPWLRKNCTELAGKTVVITGATGGLGVPVCRMLLSLSARLVLLCRSREKAEHLIVVLKGEFPEGIVTWLPADLRDMDSVKQVCLKLKKMPIDILMHNAGAYQIPEEPCSTGYHPVYQINFLSPYYMTKELLPVLEQRRGKVVVVGSIAYRYSHIDPENRDFSGRKIHLVYGNSKRYLIFSHTELMQKHPQAAFSIVHPGLAFTAISNHFSDALYALLKWPMKLIYMRPEMSARSLVKGICREVPMLYWMGPRYFNIWGDPSVKKLTGCGKAEQQRIYETAEQIIKEL